jgi:serine/threonine protein kinase
MMKFVAENMLLPVPKVYCSFIYQNHDYIVMERIQGGEIPRVWKKLSEQSHPKVLMQLKCMFKELWALTPPSGTGAESCTSRSLHNSHIPQSLLHFGPVMTIQEFHLWLRENL